MSDSISVDNRQIYIHPSVEVVISCLLFEVKAMPVVKSPTAHFAWIAPDYKFQMRTYRSLLLQAT